MPDIFHPLLQNEVVSSFRKQPGLTNVIRGAGVAGGNGFKKEFTDALLYEMPLLTDGHCVCVLYNWSQHQSEIFYKLIGFGIGADRPC